jgi:hypothetical protein
MDGSGRQIGVAPYGGDGFESLLIPSQATAPVIASAAPTKNALRPMCILDRLATIGMPMIPPNPFSHYLPEVAQT